MFRVTVGFSLANGGWVTTIAASEAPDLFSGLQEQAGEELRRTPEFARAEKLRNEKERSDATRAKFADEVERLRSERDRVIAEAADGFSAVAADLGRQIADAIVARDTATDLLGPMIADAEAQLRKRAQEIADRLVSSAQQEIESRCRAAARILEREIAKSPACLAALQEIRKQRQFARRFMEPSAYKMVAVGVANAALSSVGTDRAPKEPSRVMADVLEILAVAR